MPTHKPTVRFLALLRRTAKSAQATAAGRVGPDESAIWLLHERAAARAKEAGDAAQRLASSLAKQRGTLDGVSDRMRILSSRAVEQGTAIARLVEAFERLSLVALNAGLEGARLGESAGKGLLLVAEEVRGHAARGVDGGHELSARFHELGGELSQLFAQLGAVREASMLASEEAARTSGAAAELDKALEALGEKLRKATGSDAETVRAVAEAAEHARALVHALSTLSGKVPRTLLVGALRPVLDPIARLLTDDEHDANAPGTSP